jgi:hypothetical protein
LNKVAHVAIMTGGHGGLETAAACQENSWRDRARKRVLLCDEWVEENVLAPVAHRQYVFAVLQPLAA